jgi:hypothetical protein
MKKNNGIDLNKNPTMDYRLFIKISDQSLARSWRFILGFLDQITLTIK